MIHHLPPPPPEPPVVRDLDCLAPKFRAKVVAMLANLTKDGFDAIVWESCRSDERQAWLYGMGREYDDDRGIVTNAPTGNHGWHKFGLAVDVISRRQHWNAPAAWWVALGRAAHKQGLAWGGAWPRFQDRPHVQWGAPMRQSPSRRAAQLYAQGGNEAIWKEVGAL